MEIDDDEILRGLAAGRSMEYSSWPALLPRVTARIEKIAREAFPIPKLPPPPPPPQPFSSAATIPSSVPRGPDSDLSENFLAPLSSSSPADRRHSSPLSDTNKENNNPVVPQAAPSAPSAPAAPAPLPPGVLPPQLDRMLSEITSYLKSTFPTYPPHTIQRISELVVNPKQHYRSVITYLHALDRVVRVTSGLNVYPLPSTHAEIPTNLANGVLEAPARPSPWASPGSDEALGGALLTPIPWIPHNQRSVTGSSMQAAQLSHTQQPQPTSSAQEVPAEFEGEVRTESTETIDGPNGVGSIETVSVSVNGIPSMGARGVSVTQGELLRQEQEAGVVPVSQLVPSHHIHPGSNASAAAQQQQQIQARIQQQRSLAQSQNQARVPSTEPSDSPSPASNTVSTPSTTTLDGECVAATADNIPVAIGSVHSNNAEDEEKPHASGPEEIGADDLGPQSTTSSTLPASTSTTGSRMQGIDIQAAVGRKPLDTLTPANSEDNAKNDESEEMEVDEDKREPRASTPKRSAEEGLGGSASKKLKEENPDSAVTDEDPKPNEAGSTSEEVSNEDAMDKD
ncbi:hypothetical protein F5B22DRAFT_621827 [Xylaria bambusicola]|uniref:uncharacterized protein n=1 Tax=Xylaria bambusicola TaxID=326684 RepID=UPI002008C9A4|nr:uncharacterized protein F5B22DRAFT_621827 [Xylaria bambusicola]KAI0506905.1 hypothetical protein F5B22DRAFT_621827 [Xylaria bambusicola]